MLAALTEVGFSVDEGGEGGGVSIPVILLVVPVEVGQAS